MFIDEYHTLSSVSKPQWLLCIHGIIRLFVHHFPICDSPTRWVVQDDCFFSSVLLLLLDGTIPLFTQENRYLCLSLTACCYGGGVLGCRQHHTLFCFHRSSALQMVLKLPTKGFLRKRSNGQVIVFPAHKVRRFQWSLSLFLREEFEF